MGESATLDSNIRIRSLVFLGLVCGVSNGLGSDLLGVGGNGNRPAIDAADENELPPILAVLAFLGEREGPSRTMGADPLYEGDGEMDDRSLTVEGSVRSLTASRRREEMKSSPDPVKNGLISNVPPSD